MNVEEMSRGELIILVRKLEKQLIEIAVRCAVSETVRGLVTQAAPEVIKNATRYNWLRRQHWSDGQMAVVRYPKHAVKLGAHCPSGEYLDKLIDEAMSNEG